MLDPVSTTKTTLVDSKISLTSKFLSQDSFIKQNLYHERVNPYNVAAFKLMRQHRRIWYLF